MTDADDSPARQIERVRHVNAWATINAILMVLFFAAGLLLLFAAISSSVFAALFVVVWLCLVGYGAFTLVSELETQQDGLHVDYVFAGRRVIPWASVQEVSVRRQGNRVCFVRFGDRFDQVVIFSLGEFSRRGTRTGNRMVEAIAQAAHLLKTSDSTEFKPVYRRPDGSVDSDRPASVRIEDEQLEVTLADGRVFSASLAWYPRLVAASAEERDNFVLERNGVYWPGLDVDVSVYDLIDGEPPINE